MRQPQTPLGRSALRTLHRALEGLRCGVQPYLVAEARLGDMIEVLWDCRATEIDPLVVRVFAEALRLLRPAPHAETCFTGEASEQEAFTWQLSRLAALESALLDYLQEAPSPLCQSLAGVRGLQQRDVLLALADLRAEAGAAILPLLEMPRFAYAEWAVEVLTWSRDARVAPFLRDWAAGAYRCCGGLVGAGVLSRRVRPRRRLTYLTTRSCKPCVATRPVRPKASCCWQHGIGPATRTSALGSFGWWEPLERAAVLDCLHKACHDPNADVRQ